MSVGLVSEIFCQWFPLFCFTLSNSYVLNEDRINQMSGDTEVSARPLIVA